MSLKQREIKIKPRIKLNHNIYGSNLVSSLFTDPLFSLQSPSREICLLSFHKYAKESVLWGTIMWSEMGKQNIQTKKAYMYYKIFYVSTKIMKPGCVLKNLQFIFSPQGGRQAWLCRVQLKLMSTYIHTYMYLEKLNLRYTIKNTYRTTLH